MKSLLNPTMQQVADAFTDVTGAEDVEVTCSTSGILWVNVNGICILRICQIKNLDLNGTVIENAGQS
jgi:hypothetical protein